MYGWMDVWMNERADGCIYVCYIVKFYYVIQSNIHISETISAMNALLKLAVLLVTVATVCYGQRTTLESNVNSMFGSWGESQYCPDGSFAVGFVIKVIN